MGIPKWQRDGNGNETFFTENRMKNIYRIEKYFLT
jgi:hypothetical protein